MKTQRKTKNEQVQIINGRVEQAYTLIVSGAIDLLKGFKSVELRTYCQMEHTKNELNANFIREFLCCFWNITLVRNPKDCRDYIAIDFSIEALEKFGSKLTNQLLFKIYSVLHSDKEAIDTQSSLKINFIPLELLNYYNSTIARGETEYISITTIEATSILKQDGKSHDLY